MEKMPVKLSNSVFFHIPKTGGTWVTRMLSDMGFETINPEPRHPLGLDRQHTPPANFDCGDKKRFCFIRHPLTWYQSYFRYKNKGEYKMAHQAWAPDETEIDKCAHTNFNGFISKVLDRWPDGYVSTIYDEFLNDMDYIGKKEQLTADIYLILKELGEDFNMKTYARYTAGLVNISFNVDVDTKYNRENFEGVLKADKAIINKFYKVKKL